MKLLRYLPACTVLVSVSFLATSCATTSPEPIQETATVATGAPVDEAPPTADATATEIPQSGSTEFVMSGTSTGVVEPASVGSTFLNPQLAAGLREDPGQTADGSIEGLVTFGDLSLLGADIDELLDYIYKPETDRAKRFKFPQRVVENAGENKAVVGYMIALEYKRGTDEVISFMLVRDLQACCFGGVPRPDEWVMVEMEEGKSTEYHMYVPITVYGTFTPGRVEDEYGYASAIYNLVATDVEPYAAPPKKKK